MIIFLTQKCPNHIDKSLDFFQSFFFPSFLWNAHLSVALVNRVYEFATNIHPSGFGYIQSVMNSIENAFAVLLKLISIHWVNYIFTVVMFVFNKREPLILA